MIKNIQDTACAFLNEIDLVCFSHLRWGFVYQRPQHLLSRFAKHTRVFFIEEPIYHDGPDKIQLTETEKNIFIAVPFLTNGTTHEGAIEKQKQLIDSLFPLMDINRYFSWYYTPMALPFTGHLTPEVIVYDCMDELSAFKNAPVELKDNEKKLMQMADIVYTGGHSIYEAKKERHTNIHPFPSSIDKQHFGLARTIKNEPGDQAHIPHPRFGFFGVIDERMDIDLIANVAEAKPDWHFIIIGPVVKINPDSLPRLSNIHYIGSKSYQQLPHYIANWDIAIIPFAMNESTRYISPTKTPEYLAAGKPVISTPIRDVVAPYGNNKLVHIAANAAEFIKCAEAELKKKNRNAWQKKVDAFLADISWDRTWSQMVRLIENNLNVKTTTPPLKEKLYV
jgi:UDP-galactopyranose mutase